MYMYIYISNNDNNGSSDIDSILLQASNDYEQ